MLGKFCFKPKSYIRPLQVTVPRYLGSEPFCIMHNSIYAFCIIYSSYSPSLITASRSTTSKPVRLGSSRTHGHSDCHTTSSEISYYRCLVNRKVASAMPWKIFLCRSQRKDTKCLESTCTRQGLGRRPSYITIQNYSNRRGILHPGSSIASRLN